MFPLSLYIGEDHPEPGFYSVQVQANAATVTLTARKLDFIIQIIHFVAETRNNPAFRDTSLGDDRWRTMPKKIVDLSPSFRDDNVVMEKDGEFDDRYYFRISQGKSSWMLFEVAGEVLDDLLNCLKDAVDSHHLLPLQ